MKTARRKRYALLCAALCISLAVSGCATLLGGKYRTAAVYVHTSDSVAVLSPAGIQPRDSTGKIRKFRVPRAAADVKIRCTDGMQSVVFTLKSEMSMSWFTADFLIFPTVIWLTAFRRHGTPIRMRG